MFYFNSRTDARNFAKKNPSYKFVDCGQSASRRWAVRVLKAKA